MSSVTTFGGRGRARTTLGGAALVGCLLVSGCAGAADPGPAAPSASASSSASAPSPAALVIDITIAGGKVNPNGQKINASVGQQVTLNVTSDETDEIHAHIGGDGYELEVPAGQQTTGSFTLTSAGSFEVESHHLEKIIVIVNAS